jgi:TrmH family RNA methyltransferase
MRRTCWAFLSPEWKNWKRSAPPPTSFLSRLRKFATPGNLGTIIRTADAAGARGIILIGNTCDPWSPEAIRATMGAFSRIKIVSATAEDFSGWRKTWKGAVIGTHLSAKTVDYREADYSRPLVILMGSEQNGLSPRLTETADKLVRIPMGEKTESLNLAVSTGIMLYEAFRQQK